MTLADLFLAPIFCFLILRIGKAYRDKRHKNTAITPYFMTGLKIKLLASFLFGLFYQFYFTKGNLDNDRLICCDNGTYYYSGYVVYNTLVTDPAVGIDFLLTKAGGPVPGFDYVNGYGMDKPGDPEQVLMYKIVALTSLLSFGFYLPTAFFFALFAFSGQWKILEVFYEKYPTLHKQLAYACLFIPSVVFWGSNILKDTICIGMLGWFFFAFNNLVQRRQILKSLFVLYVTGATLLALKAYILLAFLPGLMLWMYFSFLRSVTNKALRYTSAIIVISMFSVSSGYILKAVGNVSQKYQLDQIKKVAEGFHSYHTTLSESGQAGSGYSLNITGYTAGAMLRVFPQAVNVTLFRPYIWETTSPQMMMSAVESLILIFLTLYLIYQSGILSFIRYLANPEIALCVTFTIILAFAIGVTAFNFGALVRFKIPIMPFFFVSLILVNHLKAQDQIKKQEAKLRRQQALAKPI